MVVIDNSILILVGIVLTFIAVLALIFIKKGKGGLTINKEGLSVSVDKGEEEKQASSNDTSTKEESSNSPTIENSPKAKITNNTQSNSGTGGINIGGDSIKIGRQINQGEKSTYIEKQENKGKK